VCAIWTRLHASVLVSIVLLLMGLAGCGDTEDPIVAAPAADDTGIDLRSESLLSDHCFGWPETPFDASNHAIIGTGVEVGEQAIEFTLAGTDGRIYSLSELLKTRPVLLVLGGYTCPFWRSSVSVLNELASLPLDDVHTYGEALHIVHVSVIEPHPKGPDPSPYAGVVSEVRYSIPQPRDYVGRTSAANDMANLLTGEQIVLLDDLAPLSRNNPVWCSYGPAPNSVYLIDQTGMLRFIQDRFDITPLKPAIDTVLSE